MARRIRARWSISATTSATQPASPRTQPGRWRPRRTDRVAHSPTRRDPAAGRSGGSRAAVRRGQHPWSLAYLAAHRQNATLAHAIDDACGRGIPGRGGGSDAHVAADLERFDVVREVTDAEQDLGGLECQEHPEHGHVDL